MGLISPALFPQQKAVKIGLAPMVCRHIENGWAVSYSLERKKIPKRLPGAVNRVYGSIAQSGRAAA